MVAAGAQRQVSAVADRITLDGDAKPYRRWRRAVGRGPPAVVSRAGSCLNAGWPEPPRTGSEVRRSPAAAPRRCLRRGAWRAPGCRCRAATAGWLCRMALSTTPARPPSTRPQVGHGGSLGELMHQPVELAVCVTELAVEQREAFNEEPHMHGGGFGRARCQLDSRGAADHVASRHRSDGCGAASTLGSRTPRELVGPGSAGSARERAPTAPRRRRQPRRGTAGSSARAAAASDSPGARVPASALRSRATTRATR